MKPNEIARLLGFERRKVNYIVYSVYRKAGVNSIVTLERGLDEMPEE
jgi:DNA-binding CsgD family transcriptional regulator